jgi:hypothetical protein
MGTVATFWNSRNLASSWNIGAGNHHYILIVVEAVRLPTTIKTQTHNGAEFMTLGAFSVGGNMVFEANNASDSASAKDIFDKTPIKDFFNPFDWGTQQHLVKPPGGNAFQFASNVTQFALNYQAKTKVNPLPYGLFDDNCASWVNTLFKVAGISAAERVRLGQFWGIDAAEKLEIPEDLFRNNSYVPRSYIRR